MHCVLEALASLHAADVVFGDVKPSNFALTKVFSVLCMRLRKCMEVYSATRTYVPCRQRQ